LTFVLLIGYVGLLELVGFVIMSSIFIFLMTMWLLPKDQRNKKQLILTAIIAVVFASCVYLLFVKGFALTLPAGILG
jgi:multisubunit Na+/H+ antiporter MnhE subunit